MVVSHAAVARSSPAECTDLYYARGTQGVLPMRVGGATSQLDLVSDAIVRSWLWLTN